MSIDNDIKQSSFRSEHQRAIINLIFTYNWTTEHLKQIFDKHDLTMQQFNILRILRGSEIPLSTLQIRERMLDKMSDTSRIVDRLVLKELGKKEICPTDKRLVDVTITEKGKDLLKRIDAGAAINAQIMQNLSEEESEQLSALLDKMRNS